MDAAGQRLKGKIEECMEETGLTVDSLKTAYDKYTAACKSSVNSKKAGGDGRTLDSILTPSYSGDPLDIYQWQYFRDKVLQGHFDGNGIRKSRAKIAQTIWFVKYVAPYIENPEHRLHVSIKAVLEDEWVRECLDNLPDHIGSQSIAAPDSSIHLLSGMMFFYALQISWISEEAPSDDDTRLGVVGHFSVSNDEPSQITDGRAFYVMENSESLILNGEWHSESSAYWNSFPGIMAKFILDIKSSNRKPSHAQSTEGIVRGLIRLDKCNKPRDGWICDNTLFCFRGELVDFVGERVESPGKMYAECFRDPGHDLLDTENELMKVAKALVRKIK